MVECSSVRLSQLIGVEGILKQGGCCCKTDGAKQGDLVLRVS